MARQPGCAGGKNQENWFENGRGIFLFGAVNDRPMQICSRKSREFLRPKQFFAHTHFTADFAPVLAQPTGFFSPLAQRL